ncbi:mannosyltransferase [Leeuwenhoekiella sp. MAR_2009_132]|uniref:mannosyltransferase n=1 Tax=Leeuwenhoekiella sp. MAR_2009_132 TaxID=1392489 RepID=UPI00048E44AA|nr:mannosyltransferase [Leeuwenhoekiella sp. MAR_2009_132]
MLQILKDYKISVLIMLSLLALYWTFAYDLERHNFTKLISLYAALFFLSFKLIQFLKFNFKTLLLLGILVRLIFIVALPNLSQDYFRFLWDGRLTAQGLNPYLFTPDQWMQSGTFPIEQANELLKGMGSLSARHYSNYPPVNQFFFWLSGLLSGNSIFGGVVVLRLCILTADLGILLIGRKLLESLNLPQHQIFWYFLNPFIVIELTGNLHFEGVMLFFLLAALYLLHREKWVWSAVVLGLSISVKLVPLLLLPLFYQLVISQTPGLAQIPANLNHLIRKPFPSISRLSAFYALAILVFVGSFVPFITPDLINHFTSTIALWFEKFEFNASVYYIIRYIGFQTKGFNIIATAGQELPKYVIAGLLLLTFIRKNNTTIRLLPALLFGISIYFLLSTTIHPWYIATPLLISVFTKYKYAIVWSGVVMLSYSAYHIDSVSENLWLIALEYVLLISFVLYEFSLKKLKDINY